MVNPAWRDETGWGIGRERVDMRHRPLGISPGALLVLCLVQDALSVTSPDAHDAVLVAYQITPAQEAEFSRDGSVTPFWSAWDSANQRTSPQLDYAELTPILNGWVTGGSFSGPEDAALEERAAFGQNGLYLYVRVTDDNWQGPTDYRTDAVDFFVDRLSSDSIRSCNPADCYVQPSFFWSLTFYTVQYEIPVGGGAVPPNIMVNYFDGSCSGCGGGSVPISSLPQAYRGMNLDVVRRNANSCVLEFCIPWSWVGCLGGVGNMPVVGRKIAFTGGYNDVDSGQSTSEQTNLRWKEREPFAYCTDLTPPHDFCDAWGDIEFGPALSDVASVAPARGRASVATYATRNVVPSEWYSLCGRRITRSMNGSRAPGVLVRNMAGRWLVSVRSQHLHP
jgi:hypothetical protein